MWGLCVGVLFVLALAQAGLPSRGTIQPMFIEDAQKGGGSRVVSGWEAQEGQFPYQTSIRMVSAFGRVFSCGGSLIHHHWVITAAHCVANNWSLVSFVVRFGAANLTRPALMQETTRRTGISHNWSLVSFVVRFGAANLTRPALMQETTRRHFHHNYQEFSPFVQTDDIGLLGLDTPVPYGPLVQPIRLQSSRQRDQDYTGVTLVVSGYGLTADGGDTSEVLRWVYQRGISNSLCLQYYTLVEDSTLCAQYYNVTSQSACQGDSGGPLTAVDEDGQLTMVGIASFASSAGCANENPTGYVRPGHYHDWIEEITGISFDWSPNSQGSADGPVVIA